MNEATPQTRWTLKDGTVVQRMRPSEAQALGVPRWFANRDHFVETLPDEVGELHLNSPGSGFDDKFWAVVTLLPPPKVEGVLTTDKAARKAMPIARGLMDYFPLAIAEVAHVSFVANEQHNPGQPMHWARGKSTDHADCIARHLIERGRVDDDKLRHSAKLAWRALALLQEELEAQR